MFLLQLDMTSLQDNSVNLQQQSNVTFGLLSLNLTQMA